MVFSSQIQAVQISSKQVEEKKSIQEEGGATHKESQLKPSYVTEKTENFNTTASLVISTKGKEKEEEIAFQEKPIVIPQVNEPRKILLATAAMNGQGDVAVIMKIESIVKKYFPQATVHLYINGSGKGVKRDVFENMYSKKHSVFFEEEFSTEEQCKNKIGSLGIDCIVSFRAGIHSKMFSQMVSEKPHVNLEEYSWPTSCKMSYALGPNVPSDNNRFLGLFGAEHLINYANDSKNEDASYRLCQHLPKLPQGLRAAILGNNHSVKQFAETSKLYFGYASFEQPEAWYRAFIGAILLRSKENSEKPEELTFVLPGNCSVRDMATFLGNHGVKEFILMTSKDHGKCFEEENIPIAHAVDTQGTRPHRIKVIMPNALAAKDFIEVMQAAESQVLTTGDHSLTEALMAGKQTLYQMVSHKNELVKRLDELFQRKTEKTQGERLFTPEKRLQQINSKDLQTAYEKRDKAIKAVGERKDPEGKKLQAAVLAYNNEMAKAVEEDSQTFKARLSHIDPTTWNVFIKEIHRQDCRPRIAEIIGNLFLKCSKKKK
jgi:hypothetical protein